MLICISILIAIFFQRKYPSFSIGNGDGAYGFAGKRMWFTSSTATAATDDTVADFKYASGTVLLAIAFATTAAATSAADATTAAADCVRWWCNDVSSHRIATTTIHW